MSEAYFLERVGTSTQRRDVSGNAPDARWGYFYDCELGYCTNI
jgi:hypothetical protein